MNRPNAMTNSRTKVVALSALAVAIGALLFSAAPAKADHVSFGMFIAPPFPIPVPVVVHREVVYERAPAYYGPRVVVERPYYRPRHIHVHDHGHSRGHRDWDRRDWRRGRGDWNDDRDGRWERRDVGYRGRDRY